MQSYFHCYLLSLSSPARCYELIALNVAFVTAIHIVTFFCHYHRCYHRRSVIVIIIATFCQQYYCSENSERFLITLVSAAASVSISFVFFVSSAVATLTAKTAFPWLIEDAFESC